MKKIICLLLAVIVTLSTVGCSKQTPVDITDDVESTVDVEDVVEPEDTMPEETAEKKERLYEGVVVLDERHLSSSSFVGTFDPYYSTEDNAYQEITDLLNNVNGRVLDARAFNSALYILTDAALYRLSPIGLDMQVVDLNKNGYISIYEISNQFILLVGDDGKYYLYGKSMDSDSFELCDFELVITNGLEYPVIGGDVAGTHEEVVVISRSENGECVMSSYGYDYDENGDAKFKQFSDKKAYVFGDGLAAEFYGYCAAGNNYGEGFVLLENGDAYFTTTHFGYDSIFVSDAKIADVERMFAANGSDEYYYVIKHGDADNLYKYKVGFDGESYTLDETTIAVPEGVDVHEIVRVAEMGGLCDVKVMCSDESVRFVHNDEFCESEDLSQIADHLIAGGFYWSNSAVVLMDDGHLYMETN